MTAPNNAGTRHADGRFRKGFSGNPGGPPQGSRHRVTILAERLLQTDFEDVCRAVVEAAKGGDMTAAKRAVRTREGKEKLRFWRIRRDRTLEWLKQRENDSAGASKGMPSGAFAPLSGLTRSHHRTSITKGDPSSVMIAFSSPQFSVSQHRE
jgi:hypothetical protein